MVAAYGALLLLTLVFKGPVLKGPWLFLLRSFFPNWKFFHAVGRVPHLYVRGFVGLKAAGKAAGKAPSEGWTDWQLVYPRRARGLGDLFHNAETNLLLAQQNLVDHFWADLVDLPDGADARQLVSFAMVDRLALNSTLAFWPEATQRQFELRMVLSDPKDTLGNNPADSETMLTTPVLPCQR